MLPSARQTATPVIAILRPRLPADGQPSADQASAGSQGGTGGLASVASGAALPDIYIFRYVASAGEAANNPEWADSRRAFYGWYTGRGGKVLAFDGFSSPEGLGKGLRERLDSWLARLGFEPLADAVQTTAYQTPAMVAEAGAEITPDHGPEVVSVEPDVVAAELPVEASEAAATLEPVDELVDERTVAEEPDAIAAELPVEVSEPAATLQAEAELAAGATVPEETGSRFGRTGGEHGTLGFGASNRGYGGRSRHADCPRSTGGNPGRAGGRTRHGARSRGRRTRSRSPRIGRT